MPSEYSGLRFILQYRFLHKDGYCITIHHEQAILSLDNSDPLYYTLLKDITGDIVYSGVNLEIYKNDSVVKKITEYHPAREYTRLSKREEEIVGLMQKGLSTKEIAHRLSISHHTARNIKQKMFEKYRVNNSIALLNKAVYDQ